MQKWRLPMIISALALCLWQTVTGTAAADTPVSPAALQVQEEKTEELKLHAQSVVLMDAETGRILYGKDAYTKRPMASTTKIMTCILALEQGNIEDEVPVSSYAASMPDVQLGIRSGEKYRLEDLLYSLMLESHNDSAVAIAEYIGGTVEGFADMMNQKARDIGCMDTCFVTPNGLDSVSKDEQTPHSTTAADLAKIMSYCIGQSPKKEEFLQITASQSRTITDVKKSRSFYLGNHNALLTMLPEAISGKTGFTGGAGYCYVGAFERDGRKFTAALLACGWPPHKSYKWEDMRKLASYGLKNFNYYEIFERNKQFPALNIIEGKKNSVPLSLLLGEQDQTLQVLMREGEIPDIRYEYPKQIKAPVASGTPVGSASYYIGGSLVACYPIYTADDAERIDFTWCLKGCISEFLFP